ncbi:MAG TPA: amino acid adenylation domain-containing protein, partial [Thermoanaerobaculia bacterium]
AAKLDLTLGVRGWNGRLRASCEFRRERFTPTGAQRLLGHWLTILAAGCEQLERPIESLPLLTEAERAALLWEWNDTTSAGNRDGRCLHELIAERAARTPLSPALLLGDEAMTYRELDREAERLAAALRRSGVAPEVRVAVLAPRSFALVVGLLAVAKAGGAFVPLPSSSPVDRLARLLVQCEARVLLTTREAFAASGLAERLPEGDTPQIVWLDRELGGESDASGDGPGDAPAAHPDNLAYVLFTSGSTGEPKGVMISHRGLVNYLTWAAGAYLAGPGWGAALYSSLAFDMTVTSLWGPLVAGRAVRLLAEPAAGGGFAADVEALRAAVRQGSGGSFLKLTPSHLEILASDAAGAPDTGAGMVVLGGEALPAAAVAAWTAGERPPRVINEYGPTETVVGCCAFEVGRGPLPETVPIGRPISNVQAYVVDRRAEPVPCRVAGELWIGGTGVARGYLGRPELTAERFLPDPWSGTPGARLYRTGDLARYLTDGNLEYLGRIDQQVKVRGFRIEPGDVEAALLQHPAVREVAVVGLGSGGAASLVAFVVPAAGATVDAAALAGFLQGRLPPQMVPSAFLGIEAMPLATSGKTDRAALARLHAERAAESRGVAVPLTLPRDETEHALAGIWQRLLGTAEIGVDESFFALGGHSLLAVRLLGAIQRELGVRLELASLLRTPTIAGLAAELRRREAPRPPSALVPLQPRGAERPFFCVHPIGGQVACYALLAARLGVDRPFIGVQAVVDTEATTIEAMASAYVAELLATQPERPFPLGGWSLGGVIAYEMALQLE